MHMVMFVLDDPDLLDRVLEAWEAAGATGVTIVESTGIRRRRGVHVPARYAFGHHGRRIEIRHGSGGRTAVGWRPIDHQ